MGQNRSKNLKRREDSTCVIVSPRPWRKRVKVEFCQLKLMAASGIWKALSIATNNHHRSISSQSLEPFARPSRYVGHTFSLHSTCKETALWQTIATSDLRQLHRTNQDQLQKNRNDGHVQVASRRSCRTSHRIHGETRALGTKEERFATVPTRLPNTSLCSDMRFLSASQSVQSID